MSQELVSVIIPTYNRAYCVGRAIDSALAQTYAPLEVIVVDDGSTDDTADFIRTRYAGEPRVRCVFQRNQGVSQARNTGLQAARGDFVALLDSDDFWFPWKLAVQVAAMRHCPEVGVVWTEFEAVDPARRVIDPRHLKNMYKTYRRFTEDQLFSVRYRMAVVAPGVQEVAEQCTLYVGDVYSQMLVGGLVPTSTALIRREVLATVGLFETTMRTGEDYDFLLRVVREAPGGYIDIPSMQYERGLEDHLSGPASRLDVAQNNLRTISHYLQVDRARVKWSDAQIRGILADTHRWVGETALDAGDLAEARRHLGRSLWLNLRQRRCLGMYLLTFLPRGAGEALRRMFRKCRRVSPKPEIA